MRNGLAVAETYFRKWENSQINHPLAAFTPATVDEVKKIIMSSRNMSCDLDPLPTTQLKACLDSLINPTTNIINASLCSVLFPDDFKQAHVNPLLKKTSLPKDDLNSYIPISNLSFIPKILERVVASRLTSHIRLNGLFNVSQSAYKQFHSTETALLKVKHLYILQKSTNTLVDAHCNINSHIALTLIQFTIWVPSWLS